MSTFYDTIKIEETGCPADCLICQEKCLDVKKDIPADCSGIKAIHLPEVKFHTAVTCNQCGEPACEEVCPTGAITKSSVDGIVRVNEAKCLGCGLCALACSYGGIHYAAGAKRVFKCDLCNGDPQCVGACPQGIISFIKSRPVLQYLHEDLFRMGVPLCLGCPAELALRFTMKVMGKDTFLFGAPGCVVLLICGMGTGTFYLGTCHMSNMTNLPSTAAGVKRYYRKMGKDIRCVCFAGDGCFVDVGFQPLSGAAERGENIICICYDNEGYMNTGIQRSGSTPYLGWTTTTPVGITQRGKQMPPKDVPLIMAAHQIPYVATATIGYPEDYAKKLTKAMAVKDGMSYIHLLSPCPTGWRSSTDSAIDICRAAVETNYFPLWEYERGEYRFTHIVDKPKPITEYVRFIGKLSHLDEEGIKELQQLVNRRFAIIKSLTEIKKPAGN
jgi:phenylglyoxylate dehydrogenase beta subunit